MWQRSEQSTAPLAKLGRTRLLLGATTATVGLFVALGWVGLPGTPFSLNRDTHGTESIEASEQAAGSGSQARPIAKLTSGASRATSRHADPQLVTTGDSGKTAPRSAGKQVKPSPKAKRPSAPTVGNPPSRSQASDSTPAPTEQTKQVSPPPPPSPPTGVLPPVEVPQVPQVPVPTVPDLPTPQVPSVPTTQLPTLP
jgi:hypothetical protein